MKFKLTIPASLMFMVCFLFLFVRPYPSAIVGKFGLRLIDLMVFSLFTIACLLLNKIKISAKAFMVMMIIFLSTLSYVCSMYLGYIYSSNLSNLLDLLRFIMFLPFFLFGYYWGKVDSNSHVHYRKTIMLLFVIGISVAIIQYFDLPTANLLTAIYTGDNQADKIGTNLRAVSIFGNPNTAGLFLLMIAMGLYIYDSQFKADLKFANLKNASYLIFALISVLLCGSKTALIVFVICLPFCFDRLIKLLGLSLIGGAGVVIFKNQSLQILKIISPYLYSGFKIVFDGGIAKILAVSTLQKRFAIWSATLKYFDKSPFLGLGPMRGTMTSVADNYYVYVLARSGIIGLILISLLWIALIFCAVYYYLKGDKTVKFWSKTVGVYTLCILIANITLEAFILMPVAYLYFVTIGLFLSNAAVFRQNQTVSKVQKNDYPCDGSIVSYSNAK